MAYGRDTETLLNRLEDSSLLYRRLFRSIGCGGPTRLYLSGLHIHSLPELPSTLEELNCSYTQITSLPALPKTLKLLKCFETPLTSLPELPEGLEWLN